MAKKIALIGMLVLVLAVGNASAHEKGDLLLGIEPHIGMAFPSIILLFDHNLMPGFDFGLRGTVRYYFTDSFSVNAGLGYAGNYHVFMNNNRKSNIEGYNSVVEEPMLYFVPIVGLGLLIIDMIGATIWSAANDLTSTYYNTFFASYFTIPFGVSYAFKNVTLSAGLTGNIPIGVLGELSEEEMGKGSKLITSKFTLKPYLGWYVDIDFPMGKNPDNFALTLRSSGSFDPITANFSNNMFKEKLEGESDIPFAFNFFSISMVFKFGIPLAKLH